ncbi:MAG TPA: RecX family transcriptional regulator [Gaiellaceae bacterium]
MAARALRYRDRSKQELDTRLERAGIGADARADALETLERVGYVDDARLAVDRAQVLSGRGYGDEAIAADLASRGVDGESARAAIAALPPERERAASLAARLGPGAKTAALLLRRGFDPDAVEAAVGSDVAPGGS